MALVGLGTAAISGAVAVEQHEYRPSFHPDRLKGPPNGKFNEVLVLGTPHLKELAKPFQPEMVAPLIKRLAEWGPTAIATENLSGFQCDSLRRFPDKFAPTVETYCPDPTPAARSTGLDVPAATTEAERLLGSWPTHPSPGQRRRLAAVFLAAGEPASGLVQWLRLPQAERRAGDGLNGELVDALEKLREKRSETTLISAPLAAQLGLERVWSVDDHSGDTDDSSDEKAYSAALTHAWHNPASDLRQAEDTRLRAGLTRPGGLLAMYRAYNAPRQPLLAFQSDFGAAFLEPSPQAFGRHYLGYWETRNLRMVANIREVLGKRPGTRLLAIVGVSHKGYYEAYLNQMHDVQLVDAYAVLE